MNLKHDVIINSIYDFNEQIIGIPSGLPLAPLSVELREWFLKALHEEIDEFRDSYEAQDLIGQVDAILDLVYFAVGRLQQMGLSRSQVLACFEAVHAANMTKKRGVQAKRGNLEADAVKPSDWISPEDRISKILQLVG